MSEQIKEAIAQIKSGDKKAAKAILLPLIKENPANSAAWLCLSAAVNKTEMRRTCLEKAIEYDPNNEAARQALAKLNEKYPPVVETAVSSENVEITENEDEETWLPDSFKEDSPTGEDEEMWLPGSFKDEPPLAAPTFLSEPIDHSLQQKERLVEATVIRELGKFRRPKDIAAELAKKGIDYNQALELTLAVGEKKKRQIALRRTPVALLIIIPTFITGFIFLFSGLSYRYYFGWPMVVSSLVGVFILLKDIFSRSR